MSKMTDELRELMEKSRQLRENRERMMQERERERGRGKGASGKRLRPPRPGRFDAEKTCVDPNCEIKGPQPAENFACVVGGGTTSICKARKNRKTSVTMTEKHHVDRAFRVEQDRQIELAWQRLGKKGSDES